MIKDLDTMLCKDAEAPTWSGVGDSGTPSWETKKCFQWAWGMESNKHRIAPGCLGSNIKYNESQTKASQGSEH